MNFSSNNVVLNATAEHIYDKFSNLESFGRLLANISEDKIPADKLEMLKKIEINNDTITLPGGPMGSVTLELTEKERPSLIRLSGVGVPMKMSIALHIKSIDDSTSEAKVEFNLDVPMMMKPMVSGVAKQLCDQFANMLSQIPLN